MPRVNAAQKAALDRMHVDASRPALSGRKAAAQPGWNAYVRRGDASALIEAKALSAGSPGGGMAAMSPRRRPRR